MEKEVVVVTSLLPWKSLEDPGGRSRKVGKMRDCPNSLSSTQFDLRISFPPDLSDLHGCISSEDYSNPLLI